jgi:hypothetical protein
VANNGPCVIFFRWGAIPVWTAETLHGWWTLLRPELNALKLSPKLYHESELQVGYQQSIAEAPGHDHSDHKSQDDFMAKHKTFFLFRKVTEENLL